MDFDLKVFFKDPPRIKEEVKAYIHNLANLMVDRAIHDIHQLNISRVLPRHIRLVVFHMSQDPLTRSTRAGLCVQQAKVKSMAKVFQRALDTTIEALKTDQRYGGIDKKMVKGTQTAFLLAGVRFSTSASVCLAACVAEVCGIMLNSTQSLMKDRTMSLALVHSLSSTHCISSGEKCINSSLVRFVHCLALPVGREVEAAFRVGDACSSTDSDVARGKSGAATEKKGAAGDRSRDANDGKRHTLRPESPTKKLRRLEQKSVTFQEGRPSTPNTCFWED